MTSVGADDREVLIGRLQMDLVGPESEAEIIDERPSDRYLTGILYPERTPFSGHEADEREEAVTGADEDSASADEQAPLPSQYKPAAMGLSFRIEGEATAPLPTLVVSLSGGFYRGERPVELSASGESPAARVRPTLSWRRLPVQFSAIATVRADSRVTFQPDKVPEHPQLELQGRAVRASEETWVITVSVINRFAGDGADTLWEQKALFQAGLSISCGEGWRFCSRPHSAMSSDDDGRSAALIYRNVREYAVGHTCSAEWKMNGDGRVESIHSTWLPVADVPMVASEGHPLLVNEIGRSGEGLRADALMERSADLTNLLASIPRGYGAWIDLQRERLSTIHDASLREQAERHLIQCQRSLDRIQKGVELLGSDPQIAEAFRLMNRTAARQWSWNGTSGIPFAWRPFQMGFILQCLESVAIADSPERGIMDLLWFPTGGGKTEAYLALITLVVFLRRLRAKNINEGGGVACFMRYTLRLLTLQQYDRAVSMLLAAEMVRREATTVGESLSADSARISVGLWVGSGATPNTMQAAIASEGSGSETSTHRQLLKCPCCHKPLDWRLDKAASDCVVRCVNPECEVAISLDRLPIQTIDELIYRDPPSLLIGTIDKFAQLLRKKESRVILSPVEAHPPDLIIQDELHLISGPLGSIAGLYETAIDAIVSKTHPIKVIGSTATIRRAEDQVRQLFDREVALFPATGLDASDSCFAVVPESTSRQHRRYLGITTAGRSGKFTLQAVMASLLQGATIVPEERRDAFWTLVGYFNSLRELGSAQPLVADDVDASIELLAKRHREERRRIDVPQELTSRVSQSEIRDVLDQLELAFNEPGAVDVVLATNMISVGVDVGRLGLMVVNGQPKATAEYIQATSRVGRRYGNGLVVVVLNNAKTRDRSNFEAFGARHDALYRGVEATSVTPFAPRARDKALHAALVLMARHLDPLLADNPARAPDRAAQLYELADRIVARVRRADEDEAGAAAEMLTDLIGQWMARAGMLTEYWRHEDSKPAESLLTSADSAASRRRGRGGAWPTLNSMRNVEASVGVKLLDRGLRRDDRT